MDCHDNSRGFLQEFSKGISRKNRGFLKNFFDGLQGNNPEFLQ